MPELTFDAHQIHALKTAARHRYYSQLAALLRRQCPERAAALSQGDLERRINAAVQGALRFGVRQSDTYAVALYVLLEFSVGPNFLSVPEIRAILSDKSLPPEQRLYNLTATDNNIDWSSARAVAAKAANGG